MNKQDLIIYEMKEISLYDLEEEQVMILANNLVKSINLSKLNKAVTGACRNLSGVTPPSFLADARWIALDNQKRLEIIWKMLDSFEKFEADIKNLRGKRKHWLQDINDNFDYIFQFLLNTKDLISSISEYGEFKANEVEENKKQALLQKEKFKLLGGK
mgnify:CR=1 FL=1